MDALKNTIPVPWQESNHGPPAVPLHFTQLTGTYKGTVLKCGDGKCMEKISSTDRLRNVELHNQAEEKYPTHIKKTRKANWIRHIMRRNCILKHVNDVKI